MDIQKQSDLTKTEKIYQSIVKIENWISSNQPPKQIFLPEFLEKNIIYLHENNNEFLSVENTGFRKKYRLLPFVRIHCDCSEIYLELDLLDELNKKRAI